MESELKRRAAGIKLAVFDVDGVFTDGRFYYGYCYGHGDLELKAFHTRDGHGIKLLHKAGIQTAIISGRESEAVTRRMSELGVGDIIQKRSDKLPVFKELLARYELDAADCAAVGDDLPDLPVLKAAGLAIAVADAHPAIRRAAHWITPTRGGFGAVRDVADLLLSARA
ncbi:MAG TPA: HAD hydrolase family protein [Gammaproteobacteria bacterium]|nr:HAD hydrolase family protein [Gammaproteobacteria bacterium]